MAVTLGTDAYIEVAAFETWAAARGYELFDYTNADIEAAIVRATDFIDTNYTFKGLAESDTQALHLPTDEVEIADIEKGIAQAVWQELRGLLTIDPSEFEVAGQIVSQREKLADLETEITYQGHTRSTYKYPTHKIDNALKPYLAASGMVLRRG